ncbi:DNA-directed RNA polymerase III subunit RPC7 isoform X4 [Tyto alba]|uniref:DNA-directed RNA polymerase III subunit RPC7 isoform X4 n=1 Tax=Tyto alba TaxID=56313 RepID=UPI001401DBD2|nr:DNA-directed RNA polymerase III subunit RPC7 isoform X4 [Tyto alba]
MAGRGRGRAVFTFNIEAIGFAKGAALPDSVSEAPPLYPSTENKPVPLKAGEDEDYMLAVKQEFRGTLKTMPYFLTVEHHEAFFLRWSGFSLLLSMLLSRTASFDDLFYKNWQLQGKQVDSLLIDSNNASNVVLISPRVNWYICCDWVTVTLAVVWNEFINCEWRESVRRIFLLMASAISSSLKSLELK